MERFERIRFGILLSLVLIVSLVWLPSFTTEAKTNEYLKVRFLDVGQGDAIHILTPDGYEMLIDGGPSSSVLRELSKDRSFFDRKIDVVIATHPDTDHVAGLVDVLERYEVGLIVNTEVKSESSAARAFARAALAENVNIILAQSGQVIQLGASTTVKIFSPSGDESDWQSNNASIVVQVIYGDSEFILTGDASKEIEDYLVGVFGADLQSDVLKLGHHGSKTSTSKLFLETVSPEYTVVSAEEDSRYGHPHKEVIDKVNEFGAKIFNTADS
jgi:competence protein ComEC